MIEQKLSVLIVATDNEQRAALKALVDDRPGKNEL
jgi:hypothetical protein